MPPFEQAGSTKALLLVGLRYGHQFSGPIDEVK
jgi:hypothetical protein